MVPTQASRDRVANLEAALESAFGPATTVGSASSPSGVQIVRAPGSVSLMGDHTEAQDGLVLRAAIDLETWIAFRRRWDGLVRVVSRQSSRRGEFRIDRLEPQPRVGPAAGPRGESRAARPGAGSEAAPGRASADWSDYVAGTAWSLREAGLPLRGFDGVADTTIPIGSGLSASAALGLSSALALLGGEPVLSPPSLAALAQRAERDYLGLGCGMADQLAGAVGSRGRAILIDCRTLDSRRQSLPFGVGVVVCDTGSRRDPRSPVFDVRRGECARAVALLAERMPGLTSLRDLDAASLRRFGHVLPGNVARRAEHVVSENARVTATLAALESGDLDALGRIFAESHASLRDRYEVSSPALDAMVDLARKIPGVVATRMAGPGLGGCTVNLVLDDAVPALQAAVSRDFDSRTGSRGRVYPVAVVDGAGPVAPA
jgi:galactokinase